MINAFISYFTSFGSSTDHSVQSQLKLDEKNPLYTQLVQKLLALLYKTQSPNSEFKCAVIFQESKSWDDFETFLNEAEMRLLAQEERENYDGIEVNNSSDQQEILDKIKGWIAKWRDRIISLRFYENEIKIYKKSLAKYSSALQEMKTTNPGFDDLETQIENLRISIEGTKKEMQFELLKAEQEVKNPDSDIKDHVICREAFDFLNQFFYHLAVFADSSEIKMNESKIMMRIGHSPYESRMEEKAIEVCENLLSKSLKGIFIIEERKKPSSETTKIRELYLKISHLTDQSPHLVKRSDNFTLNNSDRFGCDFPIPVTIQQKMAAKNPTVKAHILQSIVLLALQKVNQELAKQPSSHSLSKNHEPQPLAYSFITSFFSAALFGHQTISNNTSGTKNKITKN